MTCEEAERLMLDDFGGRLETGGRERLREHLAACSACRQAADAQIQVSRVLASRPEAPVRHDFAARLAGEIARQSGWLGLADWRWLSVRLAPAAAALLLVAGIVVERQSADWSRVTPTSAVGYTTENDSQGTPVTDVLVDQPSSEDAALLTLLAAPPDATIVSQTNER